MLYAIRAADGTGPVKFGYTGGTAESRLDDLQTGSPVKLVVVATTSGQATDEADVHRALKSHRLHGEWFEWCPAVADVVSRWEPYTQVTRTIGKPGMPRKYDSRMEKILALADRQGDCWLWPKIIAGGEVCHFAWHQDGRKQTLNACRVAHEEFIGPIPSGHVVAKSCKVRNCVNPGHLVAQKRPPGPYVNRGAPGDRNGMRTRPERRPFGERNGMRLRPDIGMAKRRLTDEQAREIRESCESLGALGRRFSVSPKTIKNIRLGVTYQILRGAPTHSG